MPKIFVQFRLNSFSIQKFAYILPKAPQRSHVPIGVRVSLAHRYQSICAQRDCRACCGDSAVADSTTAT